MSAQGVRAGKAFVEIGANDDKLRAALASATQRLTSFGTAMLKVGGGFSTMGAAMVAPMFAAVKSFESAGSELNDMSVRTGASVEALSALKYGAEQTGASLGGIETGLRKTQKAITDAASGSSTATANFEALGLSVESLAAMSPDQQFEATAKAIASIEDPTARVAAATEMWGRSGSSLIPLAMQFDELRNKAISVDAVMSSAAAGMADSLGDAFGDLQATTMGLARSIGESLAPTVLEITQTASAAVKVFSDWMAEHRAAIVTAAKFAAGITLVGGALTTAGGAAFILSKGIGAVVTISQTMKTVTLALAAATGLQTGANYALATSAAVAQSVTGAGVLRVLAGVAVAGIAATAIQKLSEKYGDLKGSIEDAVKEQEKANAAIGKTPGADTGTASTAAADDGRASNDSIRALHEQRLQNIENENERELNLAITRGENEIARAREAGANDATLGVMRQTLAERLGQLERDQAKKTADEKARHQQELEDKEKQRLERIANANQDRIDQNAALELEASGKTGAELAKARLALEKDIAIRKAKAAGEDLRLVEQEYDLRNEILNRQENMRRVNEAMRSTQDAISKMNTIAQFGGRGIEMNAGDMGDYGKKQDLTNKLLKDIDRALDRGLPLAFG